MRANITRRGERSWRLKFEAGQRDPLTVKRQTRFVTVRGSRKDAEAELTRLLHQVQEGQFVDPSRLTLAEYLKRWLAHVRQRVSAKTYERYEEIACKHLIPNLGRSRLDTLAPLHVQSGFSASC